MEFYVGVVYGIKVPVCFNSQRDGILRLGFGPGVALGAVSIPNGMEFYILKIALEDEEISFQFPTGWNSTDCRDEAKESEIVSIPNGVEFYKKAGMLCRMLSTVSIPNGMEFYRSLSIANISIGYCFNSQRDGILRKSSATSTRTQKFVSIPNGMEFYAVLSSIFSS